MLLKIYNFQTNLYANIYNDHRQLTVKIEMAWYLSLEEHEGHAVNEEVAILDNRLFKKTLSSEVINIRISSTVY